MYFKTCTFFAILIVIAVAAVSCGTVPEKVIPQRKGRLGGYLLNFLLNSPTICKGCPPHYCDADPGIILGYCCGCRRTFDILPINCPLTLYCPPSISLSDVCHDYEYMLTCCC